MNFFSDILIPSAVVISICLAVYRILQRFDVERERQRVITSPCTVARITAGNLREASGDDKGGYLPELDIPYQYYQQGQVKRGKLIAPGNVRLLPTHARVLEEYIRREEKFLVHIDPDGEDQPCLTPGPILIGWWYVIKLMVLIAAGVLLVRFTEYYLAMFFLLIYFPSVIKSGFSAYYPAGLVHWLRPAKDGVEARPQVQSNVMQAMKLPHVLTPKEKLKA